MKILVTNCTRHAGLAATRALARAGCEVFGADDRRLPLGLRSRFAAAGYEQLPREDDPALGAALGERFAEDLEPRYAAGVHYLSLPRWIRSLAAELREQSESRLPLLVQAFRREWRGPRVRSIHEPLDPAPTLGRVLLAVQRWRRAPR